MNYRTAKLLAEKTLTGSGVETIDINIMDVISRITLAWRVTKGTHGMKSYPHKDITKIEIVDGSDVLFSLNGGEAQALCIYDRKCATMNHGAHLEACDDYSTYGIDFGRFIFDSTLAFDPKRFRNPQLKVSYDVDVADEDATTAYLEVWADCFDEKVPSPAGFLMSKEVESVSLSSGGSYHYVDLPTDYPIRKLLVQAYEASYEPWYQVIEVRLDEDNDKRIPFDWDLEDYFRVMKGVLTPIVEEIQGVGKNDGGRSFFVTPTAYWTMVLGIIIGDGTMRFDTWQRGGEIKPYTSEAAPFFQALVTGYLPNHTYEFPFGDPKDPADWYDVTRLGSLRLRLKEGTGGSGTAGVFLQQLRRY